MSKPEGKPESLENQIHLTANGF